jgi:gliding motility-associated-like protein
MRNTGNMRLFWLTFLTVCVLPVLSMAQCPLLYDFYGNPVNQPYWYSCSGGNYTLNIQSPNNIGNWSINWGDGSAVQTGNSLNPPAFISHLYPAVVDTFVVTFTELATGCEVTGVLVMEEATSASIQIPVGGLTQACAPHPLDFINSSTNTSQTTVFTWDFGDGSPVEVYDYTNLGQTVTHTYEVGTVDCETVVTLTAENYCNTIQGGPSQATFSPVRIWDLDDAAITASAILLCYPDTVVTFLNTTERNCLFQGNIFQRQEYWNFGDYWGTGQDSIIDWTPWPPTFPKTIAYPGIGVYEVMLVDSNFCGQDTTYITIEIVPPPVAAISASADTICAGETVTFYNNSTGGANSWSWHFGTGPWLNLGGGNVSRTYNTPGTYLVQLAINITGATPGCADTATVPIVVLPAPVAIINIDNPAACDELTVNFTDGSTGSIAQWQWFLPSGQISTGQNAPTQVLTQPGAHDVALTVTSPNGCTNTTNQQVFVYTSPIVGFAPQNVCQGSVAILMDQSISSPGNPIINWDWTVDGTPHSGPVVNHVFNSVGTFDVTLDVSTAHCSAVDSFQVTVEPAPVAQFIPNTVQGCGPLQVQFENQSTGGYGYFWDFGDGTNSNQENPVHTFTNFTFNEIVFDVTMVVLTEFGCSDTAYAQVLVYPGAVAQFNANTMPGCAPFDAAFNNQSMGASAYQWNFGDGSPVSNEVNPTHTYVNQGLFVENFQVQLIAFSPSGCNDTTYATITAYPEPNFGFNISPQTTCSPVPVQFPNVVGAVMLNWNFGDNTTGNGQAPSHVYTNNTSEPVTYTAQLIAWSPFGCIDTAYAEVLVNPAPIAQFMPDVTSGCGPLDVTLQNLSFNGDSYIWTYGDNSSSQTADSLHNHIFENTTAGTINYTVNLLVETDEGCSATTSQIITVYPQVVADFNMPNEVCESTPIAFVNNSVNANSYFWEFGDGFVDFAASPSHGYLTGSSQEESFVISLTATSIHGCTDLAIDTLIIHPQPIAAFTLDEYSSCAPFDVSIFNNSTNATQFEWQYGSTGFSNNDAAVHEYQFQNSTSGILQYAINLTVYSDFGCTASATQNISVFPLVDASFTVTPDGCTAFSPVITNTSQGAISYVWDFGNGNQMNGPNPSQTYVSSSTVDETYTITLAATSQYSCVGIAEQEVVVHPLPVINFTIDSIAQCYPAEVYITNNSTGADSFAWKYGNGNTSSVTQTSHSIIFDNTSNQPITYPITLTGTTIHGCIDSLIIPVEIWPGLIANFQADTIGCSPLEVSMLNQTQGAISFDWYLDGQPFSNLNSPTYTFVNETNNDLTYEVMLVAQSYTGCSDTLTKVFTVLATPQAFFMVDPEQQMFPNATVSIYNNSISGAANFFWDFGNGTTSNVQHPGSVTYATWGTYTITLTVDNGVCSDTFARSVIIDVPLPVADFTGEKTGCSPLIVEFTNTSQFGVYYIWQFGDGMTSNAEHPIHTYFVPGVYTVTLTAIGPGGDEDIMVKESFVEVYPQAIAFFTANPTNVIVPTQPVYFFNLSVNATEYYWEFGDGNTSSQESPLYQYTSPGTYGVSLIANNIYNCPDTFYLEEAIIAQGGGDLVFPNAFTPSSTGSSDGYFDLNANNFNNDIFFPLHSGVDQYQLMVFNRWGELIFESREVNRGWDGFYRGDPCQQGVYVWKVRAKFSDGTERTMAGDVTLIR